MYMYIIRNTTKFFCLNHNVLFITIKNDKMAKNWLQNKLVNRHYQVFTSCVVTRKHINLYVDFKYFVAFKTINIL